MFVRFREVGLGVGWYPWQRCGQFPLVQEVPAVQPALLAQGLPRPTGSFSDWQDMTALFLTLTNHAGNS